MTQNSSSVFSRRSFGRRLIPLSAGVLGILFLALPGSVRAADKTPGPVEALVYSTMPSTFAHSPTMAMDGDPNSYFKSVYGMGDGDDLQIQLSQPTRLYSLRITTGDTENQDLLTDGYVETTEDGVTYKKAAVFNAAGVAGAKLHWRTVLALRIRVNNRRSVSSLLVREIALNGPFKVAHVQRGPGRGFADISAAPDLADWANRAEKQMEACWPDATALLYSDKFITPNKVNVVYRTGPDVTPVAATGGGVMTVNTKWCREHPEDTGLTVHEMAHVVQSMSAYNPVWLIEGVADYIRWIKFEPENYTPRINVKTATYHDSYRTTATFLGWCELHYDGTLVTRLNNAIRFGRYNPDLWAKFCGKDVDMLWAEFIAAYQADPKTILTPTLPLADRPRTLPTVTADSCVPVDLSKAFDTVGFYADGVKFGESDGFDGGGAAYPGALLSKTLAYKNLTFTLGEAGKPNVVTSRGTAVTLPTGSFASLWLLGAAIEGNQRAQEFTVTYTDGAMETLSQNISDWYQPERFAGEARAARMPYRVLADGTKDPRAFSLYAYGFALNPAKTVQSLTLPNNPNVKIVGISVAK